MTSGTFARRLGDLRRAAGLTQGELALRVGMSRAQINRLEGGLSSPSLPTLLALARVLRVEVGKLAGR